MSTQVLLSGTFVVLAFGSENVTFSTRTASVTSDL